MSKRILVIDRGANGAPSKLQAFDTYALDASDASMRKMTPEGFMIVPAKISRTGIQEYSALEMGLEGTNRTIRMHRPKDEVMKPAALASFERTTLTQNHPAAGVNADNYRDVTIGDVHDVAPVDDMHVGANLCFKAKDAIETVVHYGKNQLSCGYSFTPDMTPGTTPEGEAYDGVMRDIVGNHVALVWNARGGPNLRVADEDPDNQERPMKTIKIDDRTTIEVADAATASLVERVIGDAKAAQKTAEDALAEEKKLRVAAETGLAAAADSAAKAKTAADAEIAALKAKVPTEEQLHALAGELAKVTADAKTIIGDDFDAGTKTVVEIRVATLDHVIANDEALKPAITAALDGAEPAKADPKLAKIAFATAIAMRATTGRRKQDDAAAAAFAPASRGGGNGGSREVNDWTGQELADYRLTHGGKNPPGYKA